MALGLTPDQIIEKDEYPLVRINEKWKRIYLKKIANVQNGYAFSSDYFTKNKGIPLIRIRDISKNKTENYYIGDYPVEYVVKKGDILIGMDGDFNADIWRGTEALLNQRVCRIIPTSNNYNSNFLYLCLQPYLDAIHSETSSLTVKHLSSKTIKNIPLPLPPLPEQRAIVSKIEQLFSELDNGIANLKKAQEQLKVYRQAVLKKAFEGELTRQWRQQQTDLPDAEELLEQIQKEREESYNRKLDEWKAAVKEWENEGKKGKKPTKPQKVKKIEPLTEDELSSLTKLPTGWSWTRLGQIIWSVKDGPHYSPKYEYEGIPFISARNIKSSGIDFSTAKYISKELHHELSKRCKPEVNDILYTKGGTTGIAKVNTYDLDFNVWVHVAVLKTVKSIYPFYLQHVLNSSHCYNQSQKYTHGVGNQDLGLTRIILITLPICSIQEQQAIVTEIETHLSVCYKVEQDIEENLEKAEALRQSILKKAFEGKLLNQQELEEVHNAPDWEPAEVLLERVQAEKAGVK